MLPVAPLAPGAHPSSFPGKGIISPEGPTAEGAGEHLGQVCAGSPGKWRGMAGSKQRACRRLSRRHLPPRDPSLQAGPRGHVWQRRSPTRSA